MEPVTADEIREAVLQHRITRFAFEICRSCGATLHYHFSHDRVAIDNCCGPEQGPTRSSSYAGVACSLRRFTPAERQQQWNAFIASSMTHVFAS
jgi:hypothetical protein